MAIPPQLESDIQELKTEGWVITVEPNPVNLNQLFVIFQDYPLPIGWNSKTTQLLIITDISYPNSKLDMFWVEPDIRLIPENKMPTAGCIETYPVLNKKGQQWLRFSWHIQRWNPAKDNLLTYLSTINDRLRRLE